MAQSACFAKDNIKHVEEKREYNRKYNIQHKEQIQVKTKEYREGPNRERILENKKVYYNRNKESITEKNKGKVTCECGCEVTKQHLKRHQQSKAHINYTNSVNQTE